MRCVISLASFQQFNSIQRKKVRFSHFLLCFRHSHLLNVRFLSWVRGLWIVGKNNIFSSTHLEQVLFITNQRASGEFFEFLFNLENTISYDSEMVVKQWSTRSSKIYFFFFSIVVPFSSLDLIYHYLRYLYYLSLLFYCGGGLVAKSCPTLATPWTVACQAPLPRGTL